MKTYREHRCFTTHRNPATFLKCAIPRAAWIRGEGEYGLIAWCGTPTVALFQTVEAVTAAMGELDQGAGCGYRCTGRHVVVRIDHD